MAKARLQFHYDGFDETRRDPAVLADVVRRANAIAAAAGDGYEVESGLSKSRARAVIITKTADAKRDQAENHTLERSIDAGRG